MKRRHLFAPLIVSFALLAPGLLAAEVVPVSKQFEIMPRPPESQPNRPWYFNPTTVDLGAAGFATGWSVDLRPVYPAPDTIIEGRRVLPGGRPVEFFLASTDVLIGGWALDLSLAAFGKSGRFVAAWEQDNGSFSGNEIWFRRFANGHQHLDQRAVRVTEPVDGRIDCHPRVAANREGRFVIVWKRGFPFQDGNPGRQGTSQLLARVFGPGGQPLTPEITVTEPVQDRSACYYLLKHAVGMDDAGNFVVLGSAGRLIPGIWGRRFDPLGQPLGDPFQISIVDGAVALAMSPSGEFVAAWSAPFQRSILLLSRFTADGNKTGPVVRLPGVAYRAPYPFLAMDRSGRVAAFWIDQLNRLHARTALAVFDSSLTPLGPVIYDLPAPYGETDVGVAFGDGGRILTVWVGPHGPGVRISILGRIWQVR